MNDQSTPNRNCDFFGFIFNELQSLKMAAHRCATETLNKSELPLSIYQD